MTPGAIVDNLPLIVQARNEGIDAAATRHGITPGVARRRISALGKALDLELLKDGQPTPAFDLLARHGSVVIRQYKRMIEACRAPGGGGDDSFGV